MCFVRTHTHTHWIDNLFAHRLLLIFFFFFWKLPVSNTMEKMAEHFKIKWITSMINSGMMCMIQGANLKTKWIFSTAEHSRMQANINRYQYHKNHPSIHSFTHFEEPWKISYNSIIIANFKKNSMNQTVCVCAYKYVFGANIYLKKNQQFSVHVKINLAFDTVHTMVHLFGISAKFEWSIAFYTHTQT